VSGYEQVFHPKHARANVVGQVPVHILVAEKVLGRPLKKGELVHHCDFEKKNNEPSNLLFPISRKEHQQLPLFQARFIISKGLYDEFLKYWRKEKEEVELKCEITKLQKLLERTEKKCRNKKK